MQAVALPSHDRVVAAADTLRPEYVVAVKAAVNKRPEKMVNTGETNGDIELEIFEIEVLGKAEDLPFEKNADINIDTYLDYLPYTLRSEKGRDIITFQAALIEGYRAALRDEGFTEFQSPALVGEDAEGGANVFKVEYFNGQTAYLATSPQFYKQIMVGVVERAFTTARVFRAEKHSTTRHLNEYITLDFEMGFIDDHTDIMATLETVLRSIVQKIEVEHTGILKHFNIEPPAIQKKIPAMKLREAQALMKEKTGTDKTQEPDLEPEDERWLCEYAKNELGSDFIFITHYPVAKRPFYTYEDENDPGYTKSFDLLFRGVEIVTGGQRIHTHESLVAKIRERKLDPEKFSFYLQTFKYGMPPHGGCAIGLERLTQKFLGLANVKEATPFPRDMNRIDTLLKGPKPSR